VCKHQQAAESAVYLRTEYPPGGVRVVKQQFEDLGVNAVMEVHLTVVTLAEASGEHRLEVVTAGSEHGAVAWEGSLPRVQHHVREEALLAQSSEAREDVIGVRGLVEQGDVHGARARTGLAILMHAYRHVACFPSLACLITDLKPYLVSNLTPPCFTNLHTASPPSKPPTPHPSYLSSTL